MRTHPFLIARLIFTFITYRLYLYNSLEVIDNCWMRKRRVFKPAFRYNLFLLILNNKRTNINILINNKINKQIIRLIK